jgi:GT2 family glycosyltransferase
MARLVIAPDGTRLSVIIVTYNSAAAVAAALAALVAQLVDGDELIVVDNASADETLELVARLAPEAVVVPNPSNDGFSSAANLGARRASGDLLLFLNPDATPAPGFAKAIRRPLADEHGWAAWMGLVTAEQGRVVNTNGGVIHFTAIAWAGEAGAPVPGSLDGPREVGFASGACLAVPRAVWETVGGFAEEFFMYHEDVDLSLRLRLAGGRVGIVPDAIVDHDYEFAKGPAKWRYLERNRWATILRTYPGALVGLLAPALVATEIALFVVAAAGGWAPQKLRATGETLMALPRLLRQRRAIQASRAIAPLDFVRWLTPELDSAFLGRAATTGVLRAVLRGYWSLVLLALRLAARPP